MLHQKCENCFKKTHIIINCSCCKKNICLKCKNPFDGHECIDKETYIKDFKEKLKNDMPVIKSKKIVL
jgi:hypothetical protein